MSRRRDLVLCHLCLLAVLVFAVINSPLVHRARVYEPGVDLLLGVGIPAVANAILVWRAWRVSRQRAAWVSLSVGMLLYNLGNVVYDVKVQYLDSTPFPSVADGLWLSGYAGLWVGLVLLLASRVQGLPASVWLDGAIGALGTLALALSVAYEGLVPTASGPLSTVVTDAAYPALDLLQLMTVCLVFAVSGWRPGFAWWLLGGAFISFAVADTVYLVQVSADTYKIGGELDVFWAVPYVLLAYASTDRRTLARANLDGWAVVVAAPLMMTTLGLGLVMLQRPLHLRAPAVLAAGATVALALVRMAWTFRQVRRLLGDRRLARTDDLTGLANRRALRESLDVILRRTPEGQHVALLLLDLDRFKEINDALGHEAGDTLLVEVATRLAGAVREQDILARLGGDEFAVVMLGDEGQALLSAQRILAALEPAVSLCGAMVTIGGSIGVVAGPVGIQTATELLRAADVAMYVAKARGGGVARYEADGDHHAAGRLELAGELRSALAGEEFILHYQPQIDLVSGDVIGVEALVRWQHPERGLLPPLTFLPLIDRAGLERVLLRRVLHVALAQSAAWRERGRHLRLSVNITARDLLDESLPAHLAAQLRQHRLPGQMLVLEVTENDLVVESTRMATVLAELRALGVSLSIDYFGTGYSSMRRLKDIGPGEIKIDRSFVAQLDVSQDDQSIVQATIELAHNLGMRTVAEGIESDDVARMLTRMRCDEGQGYHISPPLGPDLLDAWLTGMTLRHHWQVREGAVLPLAQVLLPRPRAAGRELAAGLSDIEPSTGDGPDDGPPRPDRRRLRPHVITAVSASMLAAYLVWQALWARHGQRSTLITGDALVSVAGVWATIQALLTCRSAGVAASTRRSWAFLAASFAVNALGTSLQGLFEGVLNNPHHPSPADVAYLAVTPLATAGLLLMPRRRGLRELPGLLKVDVAITAVAAGGILWFLELSRASSAEVPLLLKLTIIAYPTDDLALLMTMSVLVHSATDLRARGPLRILLAAFSVLVLSDLAFGQLTARGEYHGGDLIDSGYVLAMLLGAVAAARQRHASAGPGVDRGLGSSSGRSLSRLPAAALLSAVTILLVASDDAPTSPLGGLLIAVALLCALVMMRHWQTVRSYVRLLDEHDAQGVLDRVTGVSTRARLLDLAESEFIRAARSQRPLCALLVDVDHFKQLNVRLGHAAGDAVLADLAARCREHAGPLALLGRYGSDTLAIVLPEQTQEEAYGLACRLQATADSSSAASYTISIGVATAVTTTSLAELLEHADDAMLNAKDSGRDCTRTYA